MDQDEELAKFKWLLLAVVAFLVSGYFSHKELKFTVWGATATATVTRTYETVDIGRHGRRIPRLAVEYTFNDANGSSHSERDDVSIDWPVPEGEVSVQYLPGVADSSRLVGNAHSGAVLIFTACCVWLGYTIFKLYREAQDDGYADVRRRRHVT